MIKLFRLFFVASIVMLSVILVSCCYAIPPRPGRNFVWVGRHRLPNRAIVPGHWKYTGPLRQGTVWVPGHYGPRGRWIPGHWR